MSKVYIFDVDGTLTPSRREMTKDFDDFFFPWANRNMFYLVSGSDLDKIKEQVPEHILELAQGIFTCGGNKYYIGDDLVYEHKFEPPDDLITYLEHQLEIAQFLARCGNHIENRGAMLNFSVVGRDCSLDKRKLYFEYDKKNNEREDIAKAIKLRWPKLDAVIGGQISIDIAPKGNDKSQVIKRVKVNNPGCEYIFIGDRTQEGGNDYPLAKVMDEMEDCDWYQAGEPSSEDGYIRTREILEELND